MSDALLNDIGGMLSELVEAQRGLTDAEAAEFLATGQMPDLSEPGDESEPDEPGVLPIMGEADARARLAGFPIRAVTASLVARYDPRQPRDEDGRWTDTGPGTPGVLDVLKSPTKAKATPARKKVTPKDIVGDIDDKTANDLWLNRAENGDSILSEIARRQGFDAKPTLGGKVDVDTAVVAGGVEIFRGVQPGDTRKTAAQLNDEFRTGDEVFWGKGLSGSGIYTTTSDREVRDYSGDNPDAVMRMALKPGAKIIDFTDLQLRQSTDLQDMSSARRAVFKDPGRYAAALGYDAIRREPDTIAGTGEGQHYVVLNRGALVVEMPKVTVGEDAQVKSGAPPDELLGEGGTTGEEVADTLVSPTRPVAPAVIYKKHADGAVVAESTDRNRRLRWVADRKKFIVERRVTASTITTPVARSRKPTAQWPFAYEVEQDVQADYGSLAQISDEDYEKSNEYHLITLPISALVPTQEDDGMEWGDASEIGATGKPFVVDLNGNLFLIDGHHRAKKAGPHGQIDAWVRPVKTGEYESSWEEVEALTKTAAYEDVKQPGKWFEPSEQTDQSTSGKSVEIGTNVEPAPSSETPQPTPAVVEPTAKTTPAVELMSVKINGVDVIDETRLGDQLYRKSGALSGAQLQSMPLTHTTRTPDVLRKEGFDPRKAAGHGQLLGRGTYVAIDQATAVMYQDKDTTTLAVDIDPDAKFLSVVASTEYGILSKAAKMLPGGEKRWLSLTEKWRQKGSSEPEAAALRQIAVKAGWDGIVARAPHSVSKDTHGYAGGGNQVVVWTPDKVTVIGGAQSAGVPDKAADTVTAAAEVHTGAMIALVPTEEDAERIAVAGGEPADQLHVTLYYLGQASDLPDDVRAELIGQVHVYARRAQVVRAEAFAVSVFNPGDDQACVVLDVGGTGLDEVHDAVCAVVNGWDLPEQHTPWRPHITLRYAGETDVAPYVNRVGPVTFDRVRVAFAGDEYDIPLGGEVPEDAAPPSGDGYAGTVEAFEKERDVNAPGGGHNLRNYWVHGEGAAKIGWGTDGAMVRCMALLGEKGVRDPGGLCAEYHKAATGEWPAEKGVESVGDAETFAGGYGPGTEAPAGRRKCPPNHHRMPDGTCMSDDEMSAALVTAAEDTAKRTGVDVSDEATAAAEVVAPTDQPEAEEQDISAPWRGVLTVEGIESGDGRMFAPNSLTWADLPLPLMWQKETSHGGSNNVSVRVGSIDKIYRDPDPSGRADVTVIRGEGTIDMGNEDGAEVFRRMRRGYMRGNSVDVDSVSGADVELVYPESTSGPVSTGDEPGPVLLPSVFAEPELTVFRRGRIRATTLVEIPAFTEATLELVDAVAAGAPPPPDDDEDEDEEKTEVITVDDEEDEEEDDEATYGAELTHGEQIDAIVAATATIEVSDCPPREWFDEPTDVTPSGALTVTHEGRVYGWLAPANVRHRSFAGRQQYVPLRNVDYDRFHGGETIVSDGGRVVTGNITMNCGHASTAAGVGAGEAEDHYDNTCSIVATARVGESRDGVWIAGALLPDVTPAQLRRVMACRLSGDWRPHLDEPGRREFVAALLVPVPGFPVARTAPSVQVADGQLVASSVPVQLTVPGHEERFAAVLARVATLRVAQLRARVAAVSERTQAFHPGHPDQSVHSKGRGGGQPVTGRPVNPGPTLPTFPGPKPAPKKAAPRKAVPKKAPAKPGAKKPPVKKVPPKKAAPKKPTPKKPSAPSWLRKPGFPSSPEDVQKLMDYVEMTGTAALAKLSPADRALLRAKIKRNRSADPDTADRLLRKLG